MKVLVYGLNYSPELTGIGKYTGELCAYLGARSDTRVRVVTAVPYYPRWRVYDGFANRYSHVREDGVEVYRCPLYVPRALTRAKRLVHLASFAFSSLPPLLRCAFWKPDHVVVVVPTLACAPLGALLARLCGARSLLHIQDFELDAMLAIGTQDGPPGRKERIARAVERFVYRRFDRISTISHSMLARLHERGIDPARTFLFANWVDTDALAPAPRSASLMARYGIADGTFVVLYSGNMGQKQGLETVLEVAERFRERPDVVFLMIGEGATKDDLMAEAERRELHNVVFSGLVAAEELPDLLCSADLHLVVQRKGVADAVMPSKLTAILSVGGHALVTSEQGSELERLSARHPGIFDHAPPEDADALTALVDEHVRASGETAADAPRGTAVRNEVARAFALAELGGEQVLERFVECLKQPVDVRIE